MPEFLCECHVITQNDYMFIDSPIYGSSQGGWIKLVNLEDQQPCKGYPLMLLSASTYPQDGVW